VSAATYLFVPAHDPRKVDRALSVAGSDAVIFDLEDGVPAAAKASARARTAEIAGVAGVEQWVRVNSDVPELEADVGSVNWQAAAGAVLSKAETPDQIAVLERAGARRIILLVESARGIRAVARLARASRRVERCALGVWDLALDLGLRAPDADELEVMWHVRADLVVESRACQLEPPLDGVSTRLDDDDGLARACARAERMGFSGKLVVHPRQVPIAAAAFAAPRVALEHAAEIVDAYDQARAAGREVIRVRGQMVDRPIAERARALLNRR
jgi:citrate lyase beta subunit